MAEQYNYPGQDLIFKIKDLEEKQKILKDRLLLVSENLIEIKEDIDKKILEIKKDLEVFRESIERLLSFIETASSEFSKFAKKEDVEILSKELRMFQPLKYLKS